MKQAEQGQKGPGIEAVMASPQLQLWRSLGLIAVLSACGSPPQDSQTELLPPLPTITILDTLYDEAFTAQRAPVDRAEFLSVSGIALDRWSRIFIADERGHLVRVFSSDGKVAFTIGKQGKGPGELLSPCCVAVYGRELWVLDQGNARVSVFDLGEHAARFSRAIQMPAPSSGRRDRLQRDKNGRVLFVRVSVFGDAYPYRLIRSFVDDSGVATAPDTLPEPPSDSLAFAVIFRELAGGIKVSAGVTQPFGPAHLRAFGPDGQMVSAVSSKYSLLWSDQDGRSVRVIQRQVRSPEVSVLERRTAESTLQKVASSNGVSRSAIPFDVPRRKAPLSDLGFDLVGRLWVQLAVGEGKPHRADVFDSTGSYVGSIEWPPQLRLHHWAIQDTSGVAVIIDSLGFQRAVRITLSLPPLRS